MRAGMDFELCFFFAREQWVYNSSGIGNPQAYIGISVGQNCVFNLARANGKPFTPSNKLNIRIQN